MTDRVTENRRPSPWADPEIGALVRVRGQQWVVSRVHRSAQPVDELAAATLPGHTLVSLSSVSDDDLGREPTLVWEVEPGREVIPADRLPDLTDTATGHSRHDDPQRLGAFLDAVRWGTVASADETTLQAPFRSGITIEKYQLEPVARALTMPRVNLLVADDVGLGKTIEAGLVTQELLLRHRARRVLVVCPAPLTRKWRDEMAQKFGLDFVVLDAQALRDLRRSHGLQANPFTVHPRAIISLAWLRTPRVLRLLDEVLTAETRQRGFFDLLIVDETHHCAPPAPTRKGGYAVDSLQTQAVRHVSAHATHRLLLTATPHNGYSESWQALLEILDPRRFTRGVEPDPAVVAEVVVRRLKEDVVRPDGSPRFAGRLPPCAIPVSYSDEERRGHELLERYVAARRRAARAGRTRGHDLVLLLLKKRLFSSSAAFHRTLQAHAATLTGDPSAGASHDDLPDWLDEVLAWDDDELIDDESGEEAEAELLARVGGDAPEGEAARLLHELQAWAERAAEPADAKATALADELRRICCPDDNRWNDERVIVFTEYRDTQLWLAGLLQARGLGGDRLGLLYGGMDDKKRERLKAAFQAAPERDPVRILLATDSASEGIDLQRHCHRVISYDIPFNPNRLEQRIGRVDRHGQPDPVEVIHFVGAGWEQQGAGAYAGDLEFLSRVATKVATEREGLGRVNPILAAAVEARMLGRPSLADPFAIDPSPTRTMLRAERELREQVARLRTQVDESRQRLHVRPTNVRRVVETALELAEQPPLVDAEELPEHTVAHPSLRGGWERTVLDDVDPLSDEPLPLTFDAAVAEGRDVDIDDHDVVRIEVGPAPAPVFAVPSKGRQGRALHHSGEQPDSRDDRSRSTQVPKATVAGLAVMNLPSGPPAFSQVPQI